MEINTRLYQLLENEATKLDSRVDARIKYRRIKTSTSPATNTLVKDMGDTFRVEVMARPSIRLRDAGLGRYYRKGTRILPQSPNRKPFLRRQYRLLNRPMWALVHNVQELGIQVLTREVTTSIKTLIQEWDSQ